MSNNGRFCLVVKKYIFGVTSSNSKSNIFGTDENFYIPLVIDLLLMTVSEE